MAAKRALSTVNKAEVKKFEAIAADWWNLNGPAKGLHSMNSLRVPFVTEGLTKMIPSAKSSDKPLHGMNIVDVGCGGGILSEALARLGASVVGLDPCEANIEIAKVHAEQENLNLKYLALSAEDFLAQNESQKFDAVVASEVIEHVENPPQFVSTCAKLTTNGGSLFFTTINRTTKS